MSTVLQTPGHKHIKPLALHDGLLPGCLFPLSFHSFVLILPVIQHHGRTWVRMQYLQPRLNLTLLAVSRCQLETTEAHISLCLFGQCLRLDTACCGACRCCQETAAPRDHLSQPNVSFPHQFCGRWLNLLFVPGLFLKVRTGH